MATKTETPIIDDGITVAVQEKVETRKVPMVMVNIPLPLGVDETDIESGRYDPYEHVTINGETTYVKRGENVEVPANVFMQLRNKYPRI